jgi:hypothetical protein
MDSNMSPMPGYMSPGGRSSYSTRSKDPSSVTVKALVRGDLDEKNVVYSRAVALEEGAEEVEEDIEGALPPRPVGRVHCIKASLAVMLVIVSQTLGVSKVSCQLQSMI